MAYTTTLGLNPAQFGASANLGGMQMPSLFSGGDSLTRLGGLNSMGGLSTGMGLNGLGNTGSLNGVDLNAALQTQTMMLEMMMMLLTKLMANGASGLGTSSDPNSTAAISGADSASGSNGASSTSSSGTATAGATGGGAAASVAMAEKFVGDSSISVKGRLDNFSAAGGTGNNCADFVSAILANTQGFKKVPGDASVATFKTHLTQQGWRKVSKAESKPGDVVIFNGSQHTELVTKAGGKEAIGSNGGATNQQIKRDSLSWGSQEYFSKG